MKMAKAPLIIDSRCDLPMKRSKEQGYIRQGVHWECTKQCSTCICCIIKDEYGNEHHIGAGYGSKRLLGIV